MMTKGMYTSATDMWATPQDFFDKCAAEFGPFDLDTCATPDNAKATRFFTKEIDGLSQEWFGRCWMNPPYGREIGKWVKKAYETAQAGRQAGRQAVVVCLLPARTDTAWWHDYAMRGEVRFIRGRLKFCGEGRDNAPFPSALVIFGLTGAL